MSALLIKLTKSHTKYRIFGQLCCVCKISTQHEVRVRFAPSPTGMLHLGSLRTALYNYLFARSNGGKFVLRIEDTDQERRVSGAVEKLEDILQWAGIVQDEGPSVGGPYGPYIQSMRLDLYQEQLKHLIQSGHCYRCFCTPKRLSLMRKQASKESGPPGYDNKCRHLTDNEIDRNSSLKLPYVIRFKYEPIQEPWTDAVFGTMLEKRVGHTLEGDFIVMKNDGYPTYHFANVIDDHFMKISHVLRGEEWSISTPKHLQMYEAFGWRPPQYAHIPLIMAKGGVKLSKRHGDVSVEGYRDRGYDANALLNYLTTISGGFTEETAGKTIQEMTRLFSPDKILRNSSQLQPDRLEVINRMHLQRHLNGPDKPVLLEKVRALLLQHYENRLRKDSNVLTDESIERVLNLYLNDQRISRLNELTDPSLEFYWISPDSYDVDSITVKHQDIRSLVTSVIDRLLDLNTFDKEGVKKLLSGVCKESGLKTKDLMFIMRKVLSNQQEGLAVNEIMHLLGKDETIQRLKKFMDILPMENNKHTI